MVGLTGVGKTKSTPSVKPLVQVSFGYVRNTLKMGQLSTVFDKRSFLYGFTSKVS